MSLPDPRRIDGFSLRFFRLSDITRDIVIAWIRFRV